jgi:hypothetical protein
MEAARDIEGRVKSFWLGSRHVRALRSFQERHGHPSEGAALRAVLDVVAESEKTPPEAGGGGREINR